MHPVEVLLSPLGRALRHRRPGDAHSIAASPQLATSNRIELSSDAFDDGGTIPAKYCGWLIGDEVSPPLRWSPLPDGTADLVLVFEDLDAPRAAPALHMVAAIPPRGDGLAEGALAAGTDGVRFLPTIAGRARYIGPRPLPGHGPHRYRFHLYAVDTTVDLAAIGRADRLADALRGHVLASGVLQGTRTT
jgi:Raf kinase inhibitor-like YbhB/YbcL family protein